MRIQTRLWDENGQVLALVALSLPVFLALIGFAIDVGHLHYEKRHLQTAADAAALAASLEIRICGDIADCPAVQQPLLLALKLDGLQGPALLRLAVLREAHTRIMAQSRWWQECLCIRDVRSSMNPPRTTRWNAR